MTRTGITAVFRKPRTSARHLAHSVYHYPLRNAEITRPNHFWAADITYIPMRRGFMYLCAVLAWASRRVLTWRLSNTLTTEFYIDAVEEALVLASRTSSTSNKAVSSPDSNSPAC